MAIKKSFKAEHWSSHRATVNGREVAVGSNFRQVVLAEARRKHHYTFRVFLNGEEVSALSVPAVVPPGAEIKVIPYDKAASRDDIPEVSELVKWSTELAIELNREALRELEKY